MGKAIESIGVRGYVLVAYEGLLRCPRRVTRVVVGCELGRPTAELRSLIERFGHTPMDLLGGGFVEPSKKRIADRVVKESMNPSTIVLHELRTARLRERS